MNVEKTNNINDEKNAILNETEELMLEFRKEVERNNQEEQRIKGEENYEINKKRNEDKREKKKNNEKEKAINRPNLTQKEKMEMYKRCQGCALDVATWIDMIFSRNFTKNDKEFMLKRIKKLCTKDVKIRFKSEIAEIGEKSIDEFCDDIMQVKTHIKWYNISSVSFNEGEFIEEETSDGLEYLRRINWITFTLKYQPKIEWIADITTSKLSENEKKRLKASMWNSILLTNTYLKYILDNKSSRNLRESYFEEMKKEHFNDDSIISVESMDGELEEMPIDEFWNRIKKGIINIKNYKVSSASFNEGEFIEEQVMEGIDYKRKIKKIIISPEKLINQRQTETKTEIEIEWVSDILSNK